MIVTIVFNYNIYILYMCIDSRTSLASFGIGEIAGLLLLASKNNDKKVIGLFIMFYSLVQLFEYNIYKNNNIELNSKLLLLNLGAQGIFLFGLLNQIAHVKSIYFIITGIVFAIILYDVFRTKIKNARVDPCIKWDFMTNKISKLLGLMYITMFFWWFCDKDSANLHFSNKVKYFYLATFIFSYLIGDFEKKPSYWCMSSAILAPIMLFL